MNAPVCGSLKNCVYLNTLTFCQHISKELKSTERTSNCTSFWEIAILVCFDSYTGIVGSKSKKGLCIIEEDRLA